MRRRIKKCIAIFLSLVTILLGALPVFANDDKIIVNEELAIQMAEDFANAVAPELQLKGNNPTKFYSTSGQAIGYIVDYYKDNLPYGYVIFDSTEACAIAEYSIDQNAKSPYSIINSRGGISTYSLNEEKLYKLDPITYAVIDDDSGYYSDNYGNTGIVENTAIMPASVPATEWDDVMFRVTDVYAQYDVYNLHHLTDFTFVTEDEATAATGRYACAIQAMIACAMQYGIYENIVGSYMDLWLGSNTDTDHITNGIIYGTTDDDQIGPALVDFCADRGIYINQTTQTNADYSFFTSCINRGDPAIICVGITKASNGEHSNHAMAVEGYATLENKASGTEFRSVMVADGWYPEARHLLFDSASFTKRTGIAFDN